MSVSNDRLVSEAAAFRRDASREFDRAVKALLDLVWAKRAPTRDFRFTDDAQLDAEANAILRGLSDTLAARAKARAESIIRDSLPEYDFGEDWEEDWDSTDEDDDTQILWRFDMEGSHLRDLLEIWIALAVLNGINKSELRVLISRYLSNPFASPLWSGVPKGALAWGRGYSKNILEQISIIGQNAIVGAARRAEQREGVRPTISAGAEATTTATYARTWRTCQSLLTSRSTFRTQGACVIRNTTTDRYQND